jgi:heme/copper-type cytochrome/quinol oxidase subunit 2
VTPPLLVTLIAAALFLAVEIAFLVRFVRRRGPQAPSAVAGRSHPAIELIWAVLPVLLLGLLVLLTVRVAAGAGIALTAGTVAIQGGIER